MNNQHTHLSIQQPASRTWCGAYGWDITIVSSAAKTTCKDCLREYIQRAWAPGTKQATCRPAGDHCDVPVAREGDLCAGHANAAAQYACS